MRQKILTLAIAAVLPGLVATQSFAQSTIGGAVDTNTRVGAVLQKNTGIANKNKASIGSVSGSKVGGDVNTNTRGRSASKEYRYRQQELRNHWVSG